MEALFVKENFNIRWVAQAGFVENINGILKEYKQSRGLLVTITISCFNSDLRKVNETFSISVKVFPFSNVQISKF